MKHENHKTADSYASQFEVISGLSEWRNWCYVLSAITVFIFFGIFSSVKFSVENLGGLPAISLYVVILLLAAGTLVKSYKDAAFLDRETRLASEQVNLLSELDDIPEFLEKADTSVFKSHIASLYTIFLSHAEISQENLIETLHSRLQARNQVAQLFASILTTLGLIGTIVGLILMMSDLKITLSQFDPETGENVIQLVMGEGGALSGLDAAFYTTLLGAVFGGVVLRILTSVVDANISKYTAHLCELTEVNVLPAMRNIASRLSEKGYYKK